MIHLKEFDSSLLDVLGDLGIGSLDGTIISWESEFDGKVTEFIIGNSPQEIIGLYLIGGYFAPDFQKMILKKYPEAKNQTVTSFVKENSDKIKSDMRIWFALLENQNKISRFLLTENVGVRDDVENAFYGRIFEKDMLNPYQISGHLDRYFTNAEEKISKNQGLDRIKAYNFNSSEYESSLDKNQNTQGWYNI